MSSSVLVPTLPWRTTRMRPPCSTMNRRRPPPGATVTSTGAARPATTRCSPTRAGAAAGAASAAEAATTSEARRRTRTAENGDRSPARPALEGGGDERNGEGDVGDEEDQRRRLRPRQHRLDARAAVVRIEARRGVPGGLHVLVV